MNTDCKYTPEQYALGGYRDAMDKPKTRWVLSSSNAADREIAIKTLLSAAGGKWKCVTTNYSPVWWEIELVNHSVVRVASTPPAEETLI